MRQQQSERGAVALLTTIIISILLAIITTGLISLMISELRQSNDSEQSMRAYYAAQSGAEVGIEKVLSDLALGRLNAHTCGAAGSQNLNLDPNNPGAVGWTCQQISYSGSPTGLLPTADKAVQVDLGTSATFRSMVLEWDLSPRPVGGFPGTFFNAPAVFPPGSGPNGWGDRAAALELAIVDYQRGTFRASDAGTINLRNALFVPRTSGGGTVDFNAIKGNNPIGGICDPAAGSYHCKVTISNMDANSRNFILRLRSRYVGTSYKMTFWSGTNGNGSAVNVPDGTATIDITAKAGDVYRRVVYKVPYQNGAAAGLDYVIFSDQDVCKNFGVIDGLVESASAGCPYN